MYHNLLLEDEPKNPGNNWSVFYPTLDNHRVLSLEYSEIGKWLQVLALEDSSFACEIHVLLLTSPSLRLGTTTSVRQPSFELLS